MTEKVVPGDKKLEKPGGGCFEKTTTKNHLQPQVVFQCWRKPIFPGRHQPSIFGAGELNFRVRDGNGWTLAAINTNYFVFAVSLDGFIMIPHHFENCKPFFHFFSKKFSDRKRGGNPPSEGLSSEAVPAGKMERQNLWATVPLLRKWEHRQRALPVLCREKRGP